LIAGNIMAAMWGSAAFRSAWICSAVNSCGPFAERTCLRILADGFSKLNAELGFLRQQLRPIAEPEDHPHDLNPVAKRHRAILLGQVGAKLLKVSCPQLLSWESAAEEGHRHFANRLIPTPRPLG
jgi:hypothetical protein